MVDLRLEIAARALQGLLSAHGCGYDPYHTVEPLALKANEETSIRYPIRLAEHKRLLALEALAYADTLLAENLRIIRQLHDAAEQRMAGPTKTVLDDDGHSE